MTGLASYLRFAWRTLRHQPWSSTAIVVTLALGIGTPLDFVAVIRSEPHSTSGLPVLLASRRADQSTPNLTGRWEQIPDRTDAAGDPAFGAAFTAAQSAAAVIIDFDVMRPGGRGESGLVRYGVHLTYAFDGSETNVVTIRGPGSTTRIADTAAWIGGRLEIQTTTYATPGRSVTRKSLAFEDDRTIVVDTSRGGTFPEPNETKTRAYYRKAS